MNATELVRLLQKAIAIVGDLEVKIRYDSGMGGSDAQRVAIDPDEPRAICICDFAADQTHEMAQKNLEDVT